MTMQEIYIEQLCNRVLEEEEKGARDCARAILRRLKSTNSQVHLKCLSLIDEMVHKCGKPFHLELCSPGFLTALYSGKEPKVLKNVALLIRTWAEMFATDPALSHMVEVYGKFKAKGHYLKKEVKQSYSQTATEGRVGESRALPANLLYEEDDLSLAKAIELSLGEQHAKQKVAQGDKDTVVGVSSTSQASASTSLYPTLAISKSQTAKPSTEPLKVRALYDFEAAEVNELTFKAGELILVRDSSNVNWWSGSNHRGQGLFPASFVTTDLGAKQEQSVDGKETELPSKKSQVKAGAIEATLEIDESRLDRLLHLLAEADPKMADSEELLALEEKCIAMVPLIEKNMEVTDKRNVSLSELSGQLNVALNLYHDLMKDSFIMQQQVTSDPFTVMSLKPGGQPSESFGYAHPIMTSQISQPPPYCPKQMTGSYFAQQGPRSNPNVAPVGQHFARPAPHFAQLNAPLMTPMSQTSHQPHGWASIYSELKLAPSCLSTGPSGQWTKQPNVYSNPSAGANSQGAYGTLPRANMGPK